MGHATASQPSGLLLQTLCPTGRFGGVEVAMEAAVFGAG